MARSWHAWWGAPALGMLSLAMCSTVRGRAPDPAPATPSAATTTAMATATWAVQPPEQSPLPEAAIDAAVHDAIATQSVPGAVVLVGRHDRVLFRRAYGFREVEPDRVEMTIDTVFD